MEPVYLDYAATTPLRDEVRAAMEPFHSECFGNPSSVHRWGREASAALEDARARTAAALGARAHEIRFVRGGTESDNLAIFGATRALCAGNGRPRLLVSAVEHRAVLEAAESAEALGLAELTILDVSPEGGLDWDAVRAGLSSGRAVVSAMWVNNETGMVLPIPELATLAKEAGATIHTDASQAVGKVPVDVSRVPVDLLTATGHKVYGPKGTGVLFVRRGTPLAPLLFGGGQERGVRPGTEDVAGAVGLATAIELAVNGLQAEATRLCALRDRFETRLRDEVGGIRVNAGGALRAPHVSSIGFEGAGDAQSLLIALDLEGVAASGGSACATGSGKGSHVMVALYGSDDDCANIRFSLGRGTSDQDVDRVVAVVAGILRRIRAAA
jgi:cysteine desulfurase